MNKKSGIINPNYKIGIKKLTDKQLRVGLPTYEMLMDKVEHIREVASTIERKKLDDNILEALKYDQILSIIGGRGAGKTSILLTLYEKYNDNEENIVLPIIMPELIDSDENIISWLLSAMKQSLEKVENKLKAFGVTNGTNDYINVCDNYKLFDRCMFNQNNELRNRFNRLESAYYMKISKDFGDEYPHSQNLRAKSKENSFKLMQLFVEYWNVLVDIYSQYLKARNSDNKSPLIFIFIDDADLKPQIINELLFVIPKYLSHPNVVVFVSAAHKTLAYAVKNHMYESLTKNQFNLPELMQAEYNYNGNSYINKDGRIISFQDLRYGKEYDKIRILSDEILRKLFPVNNRFNIKKYDRYEDKRLLQVFKNEYSNCSESINFSERLAYVLIEFYTDICKIYNIHNKANGFQDENIQAKEGFSFIDKKQKNINNNMYLSFFGRYPRDIMAVFYSLKEMLDNLRKKLMELHNGYFGMFNNGIPTEFNEQIYEVIIKFLNAAVNSNRKLSMFSNVVRDLVKTQLLHWQLYVDYAKVLEVFRDENYIINNRENFDAFIEMICLLNFTEQIIVLVIPQRRKSHGYDEFINLMELSNIKVIRYSDDLNDLFEQYYTFHSMNLIPKFDINRLEHQNNFINAVNSLNLADKDKFDKLKKYPYEWCELFSEVFFRRYYHTARLYEFRTELFIFDKYEYVGYKYAAFRSMYLEHLYKLVRDYEKSILSKEKIKIYPVKPQSVEIMKNYHINLVNYIEMLVLTIRHENDEFDSLISELNYIDDHMVQREVTEFGKYIYSNKAIRRSVLISRINKIRSLIDVTEYQYMDLMNWFRRFEHCINRNIIVDLEENSEFLELIKKMSEPTIYIQHINYYLSIISEKIQSENSNLPLSLDDKNVRLIVEQYIDKIRDREWNKLIEME